MVFAVATSQLCDHVSLGVQDDWPDTPSALRFDRCAISVINKPHHARTPPHATAHRRRRAAGGAVRPRPSRGRGTRAQPPRAW
eukprot:COSAG01_NODE_26134_length_722_cov_8.479936_2_plen_82_part_01